MVERDFQRKVLKWLDTLPNTYAVKFNASGLSKSGVPDILACVNGHFVGIELKTDVGVLSELQKRNLTKIDKCNGLVYVVKPSTYKEFQKSMLLLGGDNNGGSKK